MQRPKGNPPYNHRNHQWKSDAALNKFALSETPHNAVLLFENHAVARNTFFVPPGCQKVSTRAFLNFLEQKGWIESASAVERAAVQAGRQFSQLRFPPL